MTYSLLFKVDREPWNKGKIVGQKPPLKLKEIWAIRIRLQLADEIRNLALFNLTMTVPLAGSSGGRRLLSPEGENRGVAAPEYSCLPNLVEIRIRETQPSGHLHQRFCIVIVGPSDLVDR